MTITLSVTTYVLPTDDGWFQCHAVSPSQGLIVVSPECQTEQEARTLAREMWVLKELVVPVTCPPPGNA